jgi:hypothetical protein
MANKPKEVILEEWFADMALKKRSHDRIKPADPQVNYKCTLTSKPERKEPVQLELDLGDKEEGE